jgi:hypothetical protein
MSPQRLFILKTGVTIVRAHRTFFRGETTKRLIVILKILQNNVGFADLVLFFIPISRPSAFDDTKDISRGESPLVSRFKGPFQQPCCDFRNILM